MRTLLSLVLLGLASPALAVPARFSQHGTIRGPDGAGLQGTHRLVFRLHGEAHGGAPVWEEEHATSFDDGVYAVTLGTDVPVDDALLLAYPLWLELEIDGTVLSPRQPLSSTPYASVAGVAERVQGGTVDASRVRVGGREVIGPDGAWVGPVPPVSWASLGGVPADLADGDADTLSGLSCADGEALVYNDASDGWWCGIVGWGSLSPSEVRQIMVAEAVDLALGTTIGGRTPRFVGDPDPDTLAELSCSDGSVAKWDAVAGAWACAVDAGLDAAAVGALVDGRGYASATSLGALSTDLAVLGTSVSALASEVSDGRVTLDGLALTCDGLTGAVADLDGRIEVLETGALESTADLAAMLVRVGVLETGASSTAGTVASHGMRLTALEGVTDSDTLAELSCSDGSVAKWDTVAGSWACAVDAGLDAAAVGALVDGRGYASATSLGAL
ncbi:MAG: hypothetical protein RLZZ299_1426, partial [Pseudomonadota bacterium]